MVSIIVPELLVVLASVCVGWAALWPSRGDLGPVGYHLAALPVGLLAWMFVAGTAVVTGWPYLPGALAAGLAAYVGGLWLLQHSRPDAAGADRSCFGLPGAASFAVAALSYAAATTALAATRLTVFTADSVNEYWPMAVYLEREQVISAYLVSSRSFLQISAGAVKAAFGGEWLFALYPLLAVLLVVTLGWALWATAPAGLSARSRWLVAVLPCAFLVADPSFLFYSLYVHSHAPTALYLLLALVALRLSADPATGRALAGSRGWLLVAGLATSGIVLTRPDGLAYGFVPIAIALSVLLDRRLDTGRPLAFAFFAPMLFVVVGTYLAAYARLGVWEADKLDGRMTAAILAVMVLAAVLPWFAHRTGGAERFALDRDRVLLAELALAGIAAAAAFALRWDEMSLAVRNLATNLFEMGGYGPLWLVLLAALLAAVVGGRAVRRGTWSRSLFVAVVLFAVIGFLVHGTGHIGRLGWGDSANRVMFHIVPVIVYLIAEVCADILARANRERAVA